MRLPAQGGGRLEHVTDEPKTASWQAHVLAPLPPDPIHLHSPPLVECGHVLAPLPPGPTHLHSPPRVECGHVLVAQLSPGADGGRLALDEGLQVKQAGPGREGMQV